MRIQSLLNTPELLSANNSSVCRRSEKVYGYGLSNYEASLYSPRKLVSPTGWSTCEPRVAWTILRWFIDKTLWNHSPVRGSVVSVDLELLHSIHAFQGAKSLQINPLSTADWKCSLVLIMLSNWPAVEPCWIRSQTAGTWLCPSDRSFSALARTWIQTLRVTMVQWAVRLLALTRRSGGWWRCTYGTRCWPSGRQCWCPADPIAAAPALARWRWR